MTLKLDLTPHTEFRLAEMAAGHGVPLETYARQILEREVQGANGSHPMSQETVRDLAEFEQRLDELAEGLPALSTLPADFSRADIYGEHP